MNGDIPTFDQFKEQIVLVYGEGNLDVTYKRMLWYIENSPYNGKQLTWEFLYDKFKQHIDQWNMMYGSKLGTSYFPSKALMLRKNFYEFLGDKWYEREFSTQKGSLNGNLYLFGPNTMANL